MFKFLDDVMEDGDDDNDTNFSNQNPGFSQFEDKNNGEFFIKFSNISTNF
jgi:hypothetical protein